MNKYLKIGIIAAVVMFLGVVGFKAWEEKRIANDAANSIVLAQEKVQNDNTTVQPIANNEVHLTEIDDDDFYRDEQTGEVITLNQAAAKAKVKQADAEKMALAEVPGTITEIEIDEDNGQLHYDIEVRSETNQEVDMEISADTGKIIKLSVD